MILRINRIAVVYYVVKQYQVYDGIDDSVWLFCTKYISQVNLGTRCLQDVSQYMQQTQSLSNQTVHNSHGSISYNSHSFVRDMFDTILVTIPFLAPVVIS